MPLVGTLTISNIAPISIPQVNFIRWLGTLQIRDRNPAIPAPLAEVIDRALHEGSKTATTLHYQRVQDFKVDLSIAFNEILD